MKIGFVGAGKVGCSLGTYFSRQGYTPVGYYSRDMSSAYSIAKSLGTNAFESLEKLLSQCDCLFITVPDDILSTLWLELKELPLTGKIICHCSGLHSSSVFDGIEALGAGGYSIHPMVAVTSKNSADIFENASFTIEGSLVYIDRICEFFKLIGNPLSIIEKDKKILYHGACVIFSNLLNALVKTGEDLLLECGLEEEFSKKAWQNLFLNQAKNICKTNVISSLTGPVERGDSATVGAHLEALDLNSKEIYRLLSNVLVDIAQQKHPERDYNTIVKELQK